jgi:hypothetical protein
VQTVLNGHKPPFSAGKWEVAIRKIGMLQHQACGYRDKEYLKFRIPNLHHAACALTGGPKKFRISQKQQLKTRKPYILMRLPCHFGIES